MKRLIVLPIYVMAILNGTQTHVHANCRRLLKMHCNMLKLDSKHAHCMYLYCLILRESPLVQEPHLTMN